MRRPALVAGGLVVAFAVLAFVLVRTTGLDHLDVVLNHRLRAANPNFSAPVPFSPGYRRALAVAELGDGQVVGTIAGLAASAAALVSRRLRPLWVSALVLGVLVGAVETGKRVFGRQPPGFGGTAPHVYSVGGASFPSGHASGTLLVFGLVATLFCGPAGIRPSRYGHLTLTLAACLASLTVGTSTVVLAWHWPSDVVGGWLLGGALLVVAEALLARPARGAPPARGPGRRGGLRRRA